MKRSAMIIGTACVALLLFSGWKLAGLGLDYHKGTETYRSLSESYTTTVQLSPPTDATQLSKPSAITSPSMAVS